MDMYGIEMKGSFINEFVDSLPSFSVSRDKGRFVYNNADENVYFGTDTKWLKVEDTQNLIDHKTGQLIVSSTDTTKDKHLSNAQGKKWEDHVDDNDIHVELSDKNVWDDAVDELDEHVNDEDIHSRETYKNKLINGDFRIWQRSTELTESSGGTNYKTVDRWKTGLNGSAVSGDYTSKRMSSVEADFSYIKTPYYYRLDNNNIVLNDDNTEILATQLIEDYVSLSGKTLTLSFWAKASSSTKILFSARVYNTNRVNEDNCYYELITLNTVWTKHTITFSAPTVSEIIADGGSGDFIDWNFHIRFSIFRGLNLSIDGVPQSTIESLNSSYLSNGQYDIAEVQLEEGETATPFERIPIETQLSLCQRYYEKSYDLETEPGTATQRGAFYFEEHVVNNVAHLGKVNFLNRKRTIPTVIFYSPITGASNKVCFHIPSDGDITAGWYRVGETGITSIANLFNSGYSFYRYSFHYTVDAEL